MDREKYNAYKREYYKKNREKILETNKRYAKNNPEKMKEISNRWREKNKERAKEISDKAHKKFMEKNDWTEYCSEARRRRTQRLKDQGVINVWGVINNKEEPIYRKTVEK